MLGYCHEDFLEVQKTFNQNFFKYREIGSSLCVIVDGEVVVDIWAGHKNNTKTKEWSEDTLSIAFSSTKAALALCAHMLIERGQLDLKEKVTKYWPEYGKNGKEETTVEMILNHSAGLPAFRTSVKEDGFLDWGYMIHLIENEKPFWEPGKETGYHMMTTGWLIGELIRRVTGRSFGKFFNDELAQPYDLNYWVGLPQSENERVAEIIPFLPSPEDKPSDFATAFRNNRNSMQRLSLTNTGGYNYNSTQTYKAELGAIGGITDARSLAKLLSPLAQNNEELLSRETIKKLSVSNIKTTIDNMLLFPTNFSNGFMLNMNNLNTFKGEGGSFLIGENAFGHVGYGGSSATFADPDAKISFGYLTNKLGGEYLINERAQSLIDTSYKSLR
mgnify:CR=1 FL=1